MSRSKKMTVRSTKRNPKKGRKTRRYTKKTRVYKGGCNNCTMHGGSGATSDFNVPISKFYSLNDHVNDPLAPDQITSVRNLPNMSGGKSKRKMRKMKGGSISSVLSSTSDYLLGNSLSSNPVTSFGVSGSANMATNILSSKMNVSGATYNQPITRLFSDTNPPLV